MTTSQRVVTQTLLATMERGRAYSISELNELALQTINPDNEDLSISVFTNPENIIQATIDDGHLKIFQIQDSFGVTELTVDVPTISKDEPA